MGDIMNWWNPHLPVLLAAWEVRGSGFVLSTAKCHELDHHHDVQPIPSYKFMTQLALARASGLSSLGRKMNHFWHVTQCDHEAFWSSQIKCPWHVGATEPGSCWQKAFRFTTVSTLQTASDCCINDLSQIPCPLRRTKQPWVTISQHSESTTLFPATSKNHSSVLTVLHCLLLLLPETQHQNLSLGLKI